ncbi:MAG TPA: hypothetical protein VFY97_05890 [Rhodanobacteraceae bacterium]|nr:hypothetical protein [Rhodanobacteraceae bacterium]
MVTSARRIGPDSNLAAFRLVMVAYIALRSLFYQRLRIAQAPAPARDAPPLETGHAPLPIVAGDVNPVLGDALNGQPAEVRVVAPRPVEIESRRVS